MRKTIFVIAALAISAAVMFAQSAQTKAPAAAPAAAPATATPAAAPKPVTTASGLKYTDTKIGTGVVALMGNTVNVKYDGWLYEGGKRGKEFDKGTFDFKIGNHEVIPGWEEGLQGMRIGGTRELIIPPALGYGARGAGGVIPPNATLDFEVELLKVTK